MSPASVNTLAQQIQSAISAIYDVNEAKAIAQAYLNMKCGSTNLDILLGNEVKKPDEFEMDLQRLSAGVPLQYVTGKAYFLDRLFSLNSDTLIPRPETEELVIQVLNRMGDSPKSLLDIGTGSGCIAISIALEAPNAHVTGWDIAEEAVQQARMNAKDLGASVDFKQQDVFEWDQDVNTWDFIVSNPPYVLDAEKVEMKPHVLDHEPHLALFVPDEDPLLFYRVIGEMASHRLAPGGYLCFEINRAFGQANVRLAEEQGFEQIQLLKDFHGNDRMLIARRPWH